MTSLYKTAYPYYSDKKKVDPEIVVKDYALRREEIKSIKKKTPNDDAAQLNYAVLLMVFKNLYYFPESKAIPSEIIAYMKSQLQIKSAQFNTCHPSTITRHKQRIYKYLGVTPWKEIKITDQNKKTYPTRIFAEKTALEASKIHN